MQRRRSDQASIDRYQLAAGEPIKSELAVAANLHLEPPAIPELVVTTFDQAHDIDKYIRLAKTRRDELRLGAYLRRIVEVLPIASATSWEERAGRRAAIRSRHDNVHDVGKGKRAPMRMNRDFESVPERGVRHHHRMPV